VEEDRSSCLTTESFGGSTRFEKIVASHRAKTDRGLIGCKEINKERAARIPDRADASRQKQFTAFDPFR
jgi:hypothetical protein